MWAITRFKAQAHQIRAARRREQRNDSGSQLAFFLTSFSSCGNRSSSSFFFLRTPALMAATSDRLFFFCALSYTCEAPMRQSQSRPRLARLREWPSNNLAVNASSAPPCTS